jgi:atypical dual specificity phosphatase
MSAAELRRLLERAQQEPAFRQRLFAAPLALLGDYDLTDDEKLQIVLPNFSWLIENKLAGVSRPRSADALAMLKALGVRAILSLTEEPPPAAILNELDLPAVHVPVADFTAPTIREVEQAVVAIDSFIAAGRAVAVHCGAGLGRTGTILACYLVRQGSPADVAITSVRARRPGSIETREQEAIIHRYERHRDAARP